MDNKRKLELAKELSKRKQLQAYKDDFELFVNEMVLPFLNASAYYDLNGEWPNIEYSHNLNKANVELLENYLKISIKVS